MSSELGLIVQGCTLKVEPVHQCCKINLAGLKMLQCKNATVCLHLNYNCDFVNMSGCYLLIHCVRTRSVQHGRCHFLFFFFFWLFWFGFCFCFFRKKTKRTRKARTDPSWRLEDIKQMIISDLVLSSDT